MLGGASFRTTAELLDLLYHKHNISSCMLCTEALHLEDLILTRCICLPRSSCASACRLTLQIDDAGLRRWCYTAFGSRRYIRKQKRSAVS